MVLAAGFDASMLIETCFIDLFKILTFFAIEASDCRKYGMLADLLNKRYKNYRIHSNIYFK